MNRLSSQLWRVRLNTLPNWVTAVESQVPLEHYELNAVVANSVQELSFCLNIFCAEADAATGHEKARKHQTDGQAIHHTQLY